MAIKKKLLFTKAYYFYFFVTKSNQKCEMLNPMFATDVTACLNLLVKETQYK